MHKTVYLHSIQISQLSLPQKRTTRGPTGRPRGSTVAKRVREEGKTGFPFGVIGSQSVKYNSDDLDALKSMD